MYSSFQSRPALPRLFPPGHSGTARPAISSVHARPRPREPLHPPRYTSEDQPIDDLLQARHWAGHRSKYPHPTGLARQGDGLLLMWYVSPRPGPSRGPLPPPSFCRPGRRFTSSPRSWTAPCRTPFGIPPWTASPESARSSPSSRWRACCPRSSSPSDATAAPSFSGTSASTTW